MSLTGLGHRENICLQRSVKYLWALGLCKGSQHSIVGFDIRLFQYQTGESPYWEGVNNQDSWSALFRVRAWKASSLPTPDFMETGIPIQARSGSGTNDT